MGETQPHAKNMAQEKIEELGSAIEAVATKICEVEGGEDVVNALKEGFSFIDSEEFGASIGEAFMAAGDGEGNALTFEQLMPVIREAAGEFGEKMSDEDCLEAFNEFDADGSGTCDIEEFSTLAIALVMIAAFKALCECATEMGIEME